MKLYFTKLFLLLCFLTTAQDASAWSLQYAIGQKHYRIENDQTGVPSEYLFKPTLTNQLGINAAITKFQDINAYIEHSELNLESDNVPLPILKTDTNYVKWAAKYSLWFNGGFSGNLVVGQENLPLYSIRGTTVEMEMERPFWGQFGVAWRGKNQISTLEIAYFYKHYVFSSDTINETAGYSNTIHFQIDFGREQNIKRAAEVYFINHNFEGTWGLKFTYENALITNTYETTIDERRLELYFRYRFGRREYYR